MLQNRLAHFVNSILLIACAVILTSVRALAEPTPANENSWLEIEIGIVGPASSDILSGAINNVRKSGFRGMIIKLDTPGGQLESTRSMVKEILGAEFPIIVWVGPAGARAGSAGAFITLAAHVAAMAPGTNIGAAHPVTVGSTNSGEESDEMKEKIANDTVAFIESIANVRNRNVEMARSFVLASESVTAEEALEAKVIDVIAKNEADLFAQISGREVNLANGAKTTLTTTGAPIVKHEKTLRQKLLEILSNPNLFYLLFLAGIIGLGFELTHPGALFPGIAGAICLILALIATSVLPVSYGAVGLILVGVALLVAEMFVPSFGILGIGGLVSIVIGSVFLVDPGNEYGLRVSLFAIVPGALTIAGVTMAVGIMVLRAERSTVKSGKEGLIGQIGPVISEFRNGVGQVRIAGEIWQARIDAADGDPPKGTRVKVIRAEGLVVDVSVDV